MKKYYPILLTKAGEMSALRELSQNVKNEISPILQLIDGSYDKVQEFALDHWSFGGSQVFLDFSLCAFNSTVATNLITDLSLAGIDVVPVVSSISHTNYISLIFSLFNSQVINSICIRFSKVSGGFANVNNELNTIMKEIGVSEADVSILLDAGFVDNNNFGVTTLAIANITRGITNN